MTFFKYAQTLFSYYCKKFGVKGNLYLSQVFPLSDYSKLI